MDREGLEVEEVLRRFTTAVGSLGVRLEAAYLYGSFAAGTADENSDLDVALVSEDLERGSLSQWKRIMRLCQVIDTRLEPALYRREEFKDEEPLAWRIRTSGRRLPLH